MRGGGGLSTFYVFLAVMGGLDFFGLPGLLYGPLILTFAAAVLQLYREEFPEEGQRHNNQMSPARRD
jgi:predicted PurR-regulated permease PerM